MKHLKTFEGHGRKMNASHVSDITNSLQYFIDELSLDIEYYETGTGNPLPNGGDDANYYIRCNMSSDTDSTMINRLTLIAEFKRAMSKLSLRKYSLGLMAEFELKEGTHPDMVEGSKDHVECRQYDGIIDYLTDAEGDEVGVYYINFTIGL